MGIWHWQRWISASDLLDEWAWMPGELIHEVKSGRLIPVDRITLEPISFHDNAKPEDIADAVLGACFNVEAVQEFQRENNVHTKSGAEFSASLMRHLSETTRRLFDSQETATRHPELLSHEEPDTPATFAERLRARSVHPQEIISALKEKWPNLKNYEIGAYAKGLDPKDINTRKSAEWHFRQYKPGSEHATKSHVREKLGKN